MKTPTLEIVVVSLDLRQMFTVKSTSQCMWHFNNMDDAVYDGSSEVVPSRGIIVQCSVSGLIFVFIRLECYRSNGSPQCDKFQLLSIV